MGIHLAIEPLTAHGTNGAGAKGRRLPNGAKSLTARNHQKRGITNDAGRELPDGGDPKGAVVVCAFRDGGVQISVCEAVGIGLTSRE